MVWSHDDFIREVRRQLVELEALRKRVQSNIEAQDTIERLAESHRHLLRKLNEFFKSVPDGMAAELSSVVATVAKMQCLADSPTAGLPEYLLAYVQSVLQQPGVLKNLSGLCASSGVEEASTLVVLAVNSNGETPQLQEKCSSCGKLLVSSILAGEPVVQEGKAWFHKNCYSKADAFGQPFSLN